MLKLKLQYFGYLMRRADSFAKPLMLGKIEGGKRRGRQRMRWLGGLTNSTGSILSKFRESVMGREAWRAEVHGSQSQTHGATILTELHFHPPPHPLLWPLLSLLFGCSGVPNPLWPHGLQHARPSLSFTISWNLLKLTSIDLVMPPNHLVLCPPLLFPPSIFPSIRVFSNEFSLPIRWPKYGASVSASVLPMNIQGWFPLGLTGLISLQSNGLSRVFSNTTVQTESILWHSAFFLVQFSHPYMITRYWALLEMLVWSSPLNECLAGNRVPSWHWNLKLLFLLS